MRSIVLLIFLTVITIKGYCQIVINPSKAASLDSLFINWNSDESPGGVVAIISEGAVIYKKAFGMANVQKKTPNSITSSFDLASIAKQFTATCIALLEEQGKLSKEDNIKKYYPEFQFPGNIRIKNLLDHTSGIREGYVLAVLSGKVNLKGQVPQRYHTKEYLLKVLSKEKDLNFKTGEELVYTNINYILLGDIIEKVSGMKLTQFADSAIFKPLEMNNTFFNDDKKIGTQGYLFTGKKFRRKTAKGGIVGDHNLISTIDDLILWSNNFYKNRLGKKDPKFYDKLYASSKLNNNEDTGYGYGVFTSDYKGFKQIYHGGDNGIHTSIMLRIPEKKLVVICLANSSGYNDTREKAYKIVDIFLPDLNEKLTPPKNFNYIQLSNEKLSSNTPGIYYFITDEGLARFRKLSIDKGSLYISDHYKIKGLKLNPVSENYFVATNPSGKNLHIHFSKDSLNKTTFRETYLDRVDVDLQFSAREKTTITPGDYTGTYLNESTGAKIKVKGKNQKIKAKKGIIKIPLIVLKEDVFYATQNDALFLFRRDNAGQVVGLKINAHDFRNFKLKKK